MANESPTVFIIDDDSSARRGMARLIQAAGINVKTYGSAVDFLNRDFENDMGCIVLDVKMPGIDGLQLQSELSKADNALPIIFVSGHSDVPEAAAAMKKGAVDFLTKPVDANHLLRAINESLQKNLKIRNEYSKQKSIQKRITTLSPREHTVMELVISGMLNKQIAYKLGITEDTVKVHRRRVMRKMGAGSLAKLVRFCESVDIRPAETDNL